VAVAEEWRLRDEQGSVRSLTTQELRDGLARGVIPSSALVARPGGKDFAPAFSVPELATAAIRAKRTPSIPPGAAGWLAKAPLPPGTKPGAEVPAAPRSRRRIAHTLVGIQGDEDEALAPASLGAPIVAPGAGGSALGAPRAITQVPRYTPSPVSSTPASDDVVIPRAPRAPGSTSLTVTDQGWEDPGAKENASIFDGEEDAQTLVKQSEPPRRPPPKPPGRPPAPAMTTKPGETPRRPSQQPPPLPPKRDPGKPPARPTVMGLGTGGARIQPPPRAPLKSGSTPPPPPARPVSKPPPAPPLKRTPQPPAVAAKPIADDKTIPIADEKTDVTPAPDAVQVATASPKPPATAANSPKPPATTTLGAKSPATAAISPKPPATTSAKPPATTSAKPPATTSAKPPATTPLPSTQETLTGGIAAPAAESGAAAVASSAAATASPPAVEGTPTVPMPEAREGTPTVPMPEVRASSADVDEAPTSKMAVQIVHGAAMAMRAALAAPKHEAPGTSSSSPPEAVPPSAMPPVSAAPVSGPISAASVSGPAGPVSSPASRPSPEPSSLGPSSGSSAAADLESALASGSASAKLPRPPRTPREGGATSRDSGAAARDGVSTSTPLMGSTPPPAANDDDDAAPQSGVEVPVSSLFAASGVWIAGLILVFFVGRCSAIEARPPAARSAVGTAARLAFLRAAPGSGGGGAVELRACNVSRRPTRWAPAASKNIPFDMAALPGDAAILVGYGGPEDKIGVGVRVDPKTAKFEEVFKEKLEDGVVRVTPLPGAAPDAPARFFLTPKSDSTLVPVPTIEPPLWIRFGASGVETLSAPDGVGARVFSFDGDTRPDSEQITPTRSGVFVSFRRGDVVMGGWLDRSGKALGELAPIVGSGGRVGKPHAGWNGKEIAVTFADKPEGSPWQVRVGHAAAGAVPTTTKAFDLPAGGPGGDAIAPDIVGLPDGRWILMWTEGAAGNRAIQSITLGPDFAPIGDAIALSPPSGNFGQAQLGVVGRYVTVLFLQKGDEDFELWGAVLQCG
jgi:hypothetical protein